MNRKVVIKHQDCTLENIPEELLKIPNWVCWKEVIFRNKDMSARWTKVPLNPRGSGFASSTLSMTWTSFEIARDRANRDADVCGVGFVFTNEIPYVGIDVDDCIDGDGCVKEKAFALILKLETYVEYSPSASGLHLIAKCQKPIKGGSKLYLPGLEVYGSGRYFTMTGLVASHYREIKEIDIKDLMR